MSINKRLRVAIYTRVSTEEQAKDGISIHQQPDLVKEALDKKLGAGNYVIVRVCSDPGMSGSLGPTDEDIRDGKLIHRKNQRQGLCEVYNLILAGGSRHGRLR